MTDSRTKNIRSAIAAAARRLEQARARRRKLTLKLDLVDGEIRAARMELTALIDEATPNELMPQSAQSDGDAPRGEDAP